MALNPIHALTAPELAALRQRVPALCTKIRLAIWPKIPESVVWEARVNLPLPASDDMVYEIEFDGGGAGFGNTIRDQTVWIGSTARSYDRGIVRLRATAPGVAGTLEIAEESEVVWTDDDYITVLDDFGLWPRPVYLNPAGTIYMDRDIVYSDQHLYPDPVPVLLSDEVVEYDGVLGGANTVGVFQDASDSWALDAGVLTYSWAAPGASATAGLATATPTMTYDAAGTFRVACTVSRDYGGGNVSTFTGYRHVHIFDDDNLPELAFTLDSCSGDWSSGGWSFSITMDSGAKRSEIVDRAKVILFANDNITSPGPIESDTHGVLRANILAIGWIAGETIHWDSEAGTVEFEVQGPQHWFNLMTAFPHGLEDYDGNPTTWLEFDNLDVRSGDWSFLHWRTTATRTMDVYVPMVDARQIKQFSAPGSSSLWDQISRINKQAILAHPCCDRYGRLWVQRPLSLLFLAERAAVPIVMKILKQDWREQIDITRRIVDEVSMLDASGVGYLNADADPFYMLVLGHIYKRYGGVESLEKLVLFAVQATNNTLAGLLFDYKNNRYPAVDVRASGNYRVVDIVPHQRVTMDIAVDDTKRGIVWTDKALVPMTVMFTYDSREAVLDVAMSFETETFGAVGITGDPPVELPAVPTTPPSLPPPPIEPAPPVGTGVVVMNQSQLAITFDFFDGVPNWYDLSDGGAVLAGIYQNIFVRGQEAWLTTRDDANMATTGLFYCADILVATGGGGVTWALVKSATDAANDTGYNTGVQKCHIGSLWMRDDGDICAMIHSAGNFPPPVGQSGVYTGSGGVVAITLIPLVGGQRPFAHQAFDKTLFCVWDGAGSFYAGLSNAAVGQTALVQAIGGAAIDFDPPGASAVVGAHNGYAHLTNLVGGSNLFGGGAWNPASDQGLNVEPGSIMTDYAGSGAITPYLYRVVNGLHDLYIVGVGLIGDASVEFGVGRLGGYAEFYPFDTQQIVWVCGSAAAFATANVVIYTDDQGTTWMAKDGAGATSLDNATGGGGAWAGWSGVTTLNSIARVFEY